MTTEQVLPSRPLWMRYLVAVASVAIAAGLRLLAEPWLDGRVPFGIFFLSVMVTAWYGGIRPALVSVGLGILAAHMVLFNRLDPMDHAPAHVTAFAIYAVVSVICCLLIESVRNERKRAEQSAALNSYLNEELSSLNEELNENDRRKDEFLAMLAHELRNPLMPLQNGLDVVEHPETPAAVSGEAIARMRRQLNQLVRLVDDLLNVSRFLRGAIQLDTELLNLADVVAVAVESVQRDIAHAEHELVVSLPPRPVYVQGDRVRLAQVISNLLHNATKYTDRRGCIRLKVDRDGPLAVITVRDNGVGIAPEMLESIFTLFTQADFTRARSQGGLGIGLALVRHLVELHKGRIEVESKGLGRGSLFRIRLPMARPPRPEPIEPKDQRQQAVEQQAQRQPLRRRVLIVDDNLDALDILTSLLQFEGHEVLSASDGPAAIQLVRSRTPDVVLLDIGLPKMDGYEVARTLREELNYTGSIAAVTGWGTRDDCARSRSAGIDAHLVKPVSLDVIKAFLEDPGNLPVPRRKLEDSAEITALRPE